MEFCTLIDYDLGAMVASSRILETLKMCEFFYDKKIKITYDNLELDFFMPLKNIK